MTAYMDGYLRCSTTMCMNRTSNSTIDTITVRDEPVCTDGKEAVVFQTTYYLHPFKISISLSLPQLSLASNLICSTRLTLC